MVDLETIRFALDCLVEVEMLERYEVEEKHGCIRTITVYNPDKELDDLELKIRLNLLVESFDREYSEKYLYKIIRSDKNEK